MVDTVLPTGWEGADELDGYTQLDKSELVGVPFRMLEILYRLNNKDQEVCEVTAEFVNGDKFVFTDMSVAGIRQQLRVYLEAKEIPFSYGEIHSVSLVFRNGLRESVWETDVRGKLTRVKSYFLTTSGKPPATVQPAAARKSK